MTPEEAVEVVLRGWVWRLCERCEGCGMVRIEGGKGTDVCTDVCMDCEGMCRTLEPEYVEACRLLGKDLPDPRRFPVYETIEVSVEINYRAIDALTKGGL